MNNTSNHIEGNKDRIFFKVDNEFKAIDPKSIAFFYAEEKITKARIANRNLLTIVTLKELEILLNPTFLRCHKKYVVNISHIESILPRENKIKIGGELISIGYAYRKLFFDQLCLLK